MPKPYHRLTAFLLLASIVGAGTASAAEMPLLAISGSPTEDEAATIAATWGRLRAGFPRLDGCLRPLEVQVVDRAEDHYSGTLTIAAFYRTGTRPTVFIEHGKVDAATLAHEFAHHLDLSCGFGTSPRARSFLAAAGFPETAAFYGGRSWNAVPAEHFAEAVLRYLDIGPTVITVDDDTVAVVRAFARTGGPLPAGLPRSFPLLRW